MDKSPLICLGIVVAVLGTFWYVLDSFQTERFRGTGPRSG